MKKTLIALLAVTTLTACSSTSNFDNDFDVNTEVEDCDAGDLLEGDKDCYGVDLKDKKKKISKSKKVKSRTKPKK